MNLITMFLTCGSSGEADKISAKLLDENLAACVKRVEVKSNYLWKGKKQQGQEILLIIDSAQEKFEQIEAAVKQIHSYDTFVLAAYPVAKASANVEQWVAESINVKDKKMPELREAKLFTDGGSRGNPGPSAIAFVICKTDNTVVEKSGQYIGETTNNQAEYQALKSGLQRASALGIKQLAVHMDSELVIKQVNGQYKIKNQELLPHYNDIKDLAGKFEQITFSYVPRALNAQADKEVNRVLDEQAKK